MELLIGRTLNFKRSLAPQGAGAGRTATGAGAAKDSRVVVGYSSVFGNIDAAEDVVIPGAFKKAVEDFNAGTSRTRFLWEHDSSSPPVARILSLKEVGRSELPAALRQNPDVVGALEVTRQYFTDPFSERVYQAVASGAISEMSFAFNVLDHDYEVVRGKKVRLLKSLELMDCADVNWGCNALTMATAKGTAMVLNAAKKAEIKKQALDAEQMKERLAQLKFAARHPNYSELDKSRLALLRARQLINTWNR